MVFRARKMAAKSLGLSGMWLLLLTVMEPPDRHRPPGSLRRFEVPLGSPNLSKTRPGSWAWNAAKETLWSSPAYLISQLVALSYQNRLLPVLHKAGRQ